MGTDDDVDIVVADDIADDSVVTGCVGGVVEEGALHREPRRFVDVKKGLALPSPADVEMGHMDLVPCRKLLKDVVVPRWDRVVDVILGGDEEDLHRSCALGIDWK